MRALASVMDADPQLLTSDRMRLILTRRLSDNGTIVRATSSIYSANTRRDAGVASIYIDSIVERLSDVGVAFGDEQCMFCESIFARLMYPVKTFEFSVALLSAF